MQSQQIVVSVARDFSPTPGPRSRDEGDFSGDEFLEEHLKPKYLEATKAGLVLLVDLDGTEGYATSFLEAAFGGLAREFEPTSVLRVLAFKCEDEPLLEQEIRAYIKDARKQ